MAALVDFGRVKYLVGLEEVSVYFAQLAQVLYLFLKLDDCQLIGFRGCFSIDLYLLHFFDDIFSTAISLLLASSPGPARHETPADQQIQRRDERQRQQQRPQAEASQPKIRGRKFWR